VGQRCPPRSTSVTPAPISSGEVPRVRTFLVSRRSDLRLARARSFLEGLSPRHDALLVGPTFEAVAELSRSLSRSLFGWRRTTLYRCAVELARPALLSHGLATVTPLALEASWARVTHELKTDALLHRLAPLGGKPGLSRALARTVAELRLLQVDPSTVEPALAEAMSAFEQFLSSARLADQAVVYGFARAAAEEAAQAPLLLLDVGARPGVEQAFLEALVARSSQTLAVAPLDDEVATASLSSAVGPPTELPLPPGTALRELQKNLFSASRPDTAHHLDDFFSAPGEARECVEVARRVMALAKTGVRFDDVAVLLRSPGSYRAPLEDAFRRAGIPAWFSSGLPRPDPAGRALLALLRCAEESLSARRFSEYLSLSQVPRLDEAGGLPEASPRFVRPDAADTLLPLVPDAAPADEVKELLGDVEAPAVLGQLRAPRRWERLIVDAAVIGGTDRWRRRLAGLRQTLLTARRNPTATDAQLQRLERELADLTSLEQFALPVLDLLAALPQRATWGEWLVALTQLATRALKHPDRVLALLTELAPMSPIGPLELPEVRAVLARRLSEVTEAPTGRRFGQVLVAPIEQARGLSFHTVFVPGLAERVFPQKIREDPLLPDAHRPAASPHLETSKGRVATERLALLLAVGAARERAVLSYPRVDSEHARPRVPSFYALEAARAVQGTLPGYEALARQAEAGSTVRLSWPAPTLADQAIDETEFDLSSIDALLRAGPSAKGRGRYLLTTNPHLARALRARYARWQQSGWNAHDGLVKPTALARPALDANQLSARPFSPTALEQYAACPYKFYLSALARLQPLRIPGELEELGPLEKGSMAHAVQFELLTALRRDGVTITEATLPAVLERLRQTIQAVSTKVYDDFKPAIERIWHDGVQVLEADLRQWLRLVAQDQAWVPAHFELSFGLPGRGAEGQDPASTPTPVTLVEGLTVRGSIDLVERHTSGALRATDYKTGRAWAEPGNIIGGGRHLQPVLYALVLEQLFPGSPVQGGRLFYTTQVGGYTQVPTSLDAVSREAFGLVARTLRLALETGFFPAAPDEGSCRYCDYQPVCGPEEERRVRVTGKGRRAELADLKRLRASR